MWPQSRFAKANLHRALHQGPGRSAAAQARRDGVPLEALNDEHLIQVHLRGKVARAEKANRNAVKRWLRVCHAAGVHPLLMTPQLIQAWADGLTRAGRPPRSVQSELAVLSGIYRSWWRAELLDLNPVHRVAKPLVSGKTSREPLTLPELRSVLHAADQSADPQTRAIVHLLAGTGIRLGDLINLNVKDIGSHDGMMTLNLRHRKQDAQSLIGVPSHVQEALEALVGRRRSGPVFQGLSAAGRITGPTVYGRLDRVAAMAGLTRVKLRPHMLRVTFITLSLDAGVPIRDVMASVGHTRAVTTHRYDANRIALTRNASFTLAETLRSPVAEDKPATSTHEADLA